MFLRDVLDPQNDRRRKSIRFTLRASAASKTAI
jgi:hypothetical protein